MLKEQQRSKQLNSSPLNFNTDIQAIVNRSEMLPTTTTSTKANHAKLPLFSIQRFSRIRSNITIERCCVLLIHLIFYIIILTIVYVRLERVSNKQEKLFRALNLNDNLTLHQIRQQHLINCNQ